MTPRTFLVHGLLAGLLAGLVAFGVAFTLGEPSVDDAIELEESSAAAAPAGAADAAPPADAATAVSTVALAAPATQAVAAPAVAVPAHDPGAHAHGGEDEGTTVSRDNQATWGLLTGTVGIGVALGGLAALASAAALGRLGRLGPVGSTALVCAVGFVSVALVPFLKYPATPPAVGSGDTIGDRTAVYFTMLLISVLAAGLALGLGQALFRRYGGWLAVVGGGAAYVLVVGLAGALLPTVDELGAFPASTLWSFRLGSLLTLVALWTTIGVVLTGLVGRTWARVSAEQAETARRRDLAASL